MGKVRMENTGFESSVNPAEKEPWPKVRLGDVCEVRAGGDYKGVLSKTGKYPIYGTGGIMGRATEYRCPANSVIVGRKGTLDNPLLIEEPFWNIDTCFGVIPSRRILPKYLHLFCLNFDFYSLCPAIGRPSTTSTAIKNIEIPLPPLPVQRSIVARLEKELGAVDRMVKGFEKIAEEADAAFTAELKETFEEVSRRGAETRRLGDVCEIQRGGSPRPIKSFITDEQNGLNWIKIGDVSPDGKYITKTTDKIKQSGLSKTRQVFAGDFLLSNSMSFGRPYILRINGCIHDGWLVLRGFKNTYLEDYFYYLLRSDCVQDQFNKLAHGSTVRNLNTEAVAMVEVCEASFSAQRTVVARLDAAKAKCEAIKSAAQRGAAECARLRKAILKEAFE